MQLPQLALTVLLSLRLLISLCLSIPSAPWHGFPGAPIFRATTAAPQALRRSETHAGLLTEGRDRSGRRVRHSASVGDLRRHWRLAVRRDIEHSARVLRQRRRLRQFAVPLL